MSEWTVVLALSVIVGLFLSVGAPILKLNSNITLLNASIKRNSEEIAEQKKELKEQRKNAHESHQKLWEKNDEQDKILGDHETRLQVMEKIKETL